MCIKTLFWVELSLIRKGEKGVDSGKNSSQKWWTRTAQGLISNGQLQSERGRQIRRATTNKGRQFYYQKDNYHGDLEVFKASGSKGVHMGCCSINGGPWTKPPAQRRTIDLWLSIHSSLSSSNYPFFYFTYLKCSFNIKCF